VPNIVKIGTLFVRRRGVTRLHSCLCNAVLIERGHFEVAAAPHMLTV